MYSPTAGVDVAESMFAELLVAMVITVHETIRSMLEATRKLNDYIRSHHVRLQQHRERR